jgi:hypothetical protein
LPFFGSTWSTIFTKRCQPQPFAMASGSCAGILNCVFEVEQHPKVRGVIALIHENGAAAEQVAVAL